MQYFHDILTVTVATTGLFEAYDLIGYDGAKIEADDADVLGFAKHPNTVIGDPAAVAAIGFVRVRAVGVITKGARLITAASGGVQVADVDSENVFARALTDAADGGFVDILIR